MAAALCCAAAHSRKFISSNPLIKAFLISRSSLIERHFSTTFPFFSSRKYSEKHEWVAIDGKIGTVGISDYAQEALGEVVFVQHPDVGETYEKDSECGVVESVKAVNEIYTPVSGKVVEVNKLLEDEPKAINESCYDRGWVYKLELTVPKELDSLMNEEEYDKYLKSIQK